MDEAMIQALVELGAIPEEQALLMRQADQGLAMQGAPTPQGMSVGGTYVASSPLEHLSAALQRGLGAKKQQGAEEAFRGTLGKQTQGRQGYADALMRLLRGQQQEPQAAVTEMPTMYIGG